MIAINDIFLLSLSHNYNSMKARLLYFLVAVMALSACHEKTGKPVSDIDSTETLVINPIKDKVVNDTVLMDDIEIIHAPVAYYDFNNVDNLSTFFASISSRHPLQLWLPEEDNTDEDIKQCIVRIDSYRKGKTRFFPDSLVSKCMRSLGFNAAVIHNHGPEYTDLVYGEWFMMCAAFYAPDITCLVQTQTPDHKAGFFNYGGGYNSSPWWSYVFFKRKKGYEMKCMGDMVAVRSIFQLEDSQHRKYYLCSDNWSSMEFNQWLFWAKNDNATMKVAECKEAPMYEYNGGVGYYFDRNRLIWKFTKTDENTGKPIAVSDEPALRLLLDGEKSRFDFVK